MPAEVDDAVELIATKQVLKHPLGEIDAIAGDVIAEVDLFPEVHRHQVAMVAQALDHLLGEGASGAGNENLGALLLGH